MLLLVAHFLKRSIPTMLQGLLGMLQFFIVSFAVQTKFPHVSHLLTRFLDTLDIVWPVCYASGSPDREFSSKMALLYSQVFLFSVIQLPLHTLSSMPDSS